MGKHTKPKLASVPSARPVADDDVTAAAYRVHGKVERTPLRDSRTLSDITGAHVFIKFENLQFTASFKEHGAVNKLRQLTDAEARAGVIAVSAGNHAQAVAYNAARLGISSTVVMPLGTPFVKVDHTRKHGARVLLQGENVAEAFAYGFQLKEREVLTFVHPFDDPRSLQAKARSRWKCWRISQTLKR